MSDLTAEEVVEILGLEPLPEEGGMYRQTYRDDLVSPIYFLTAGDDFSAMHALDAVEVWHWYAGAPLRMLLLHPDGSVTEPVLGADLRAGQRPQVVVTSGTWMGASSAGEWTLAGTQVTPLFDWDRFRLGRREELTAAYPSAADRIARLTRG